MSRYIDADKLQEDFKELHGGKRSLLIDTEPTADVRENVKGEWKIEYTGDGWNDYIDVTCTNCGKTIKHGKPFNFCPICGADMRPITALSKKCRN